MSKTFITDRSAVETDDACGMRFWWNRKALGGGIMPKDEPLALEVGRAVHEDLSEMATADISEDALQARVDDIVDRLTLDDIEQTDKMEVLFRRLGWLVAWALYIEPVIRAKYDTVMVEDELVLDRTPLWVAVTPDRVLRDKHDGKLVYLEYKSTQQAGPKWLSSWHFSIQLHIGMAAIAEELEEPVKFGQIVGLLKGYYAPSNNRLRHPYVWAWTNAKTGEWTWRYDAARGADWTEAPVWDYPGGLVKWVKFVGQEAAVSQFPMTAPIFLHPQMLQEWVTRRTAREAQIEISKDACLTNETTRGIVFEKRTSKCRPAWGDPCPYTRLCWNRGSSSDEEEILKGGDFVKRIPHHNVTEEE